MGNKSSLMLQDVEIKQISEETGFTSSQIERLYSRFAHLDRGSCGALNRNDLMSIPELAINPLCDRLIQMFFLDCEDDDKRINFKQFVRVLATFRTTNNNVSNEAKSTTIDAQVGTNRSKRPQIVAETKFYPDDISVRDRITDDWQVVNGFHGCLRKKLSFVFRVYDADNDGKISFNDLRGILKMMVGSYIEDIQLDKITTRAFVEVDEDNDGFIEFNEFCRVFSEKGLDDKLRVKFFN